MSGFVRLLFPRTAREDGLCSDPRPSLEKTRRLGCLLRDQAARAVVWLAAAAIAAGPALARLKWLLFIPALTKAVQQREQGLLRPPQPYHFPLYLLDTSDETLLGGHQLFRGSDQFLLYGVTDKRRR